MATAAAVREWAAANGHGKLRGRLAGDAITAWDSAHPGDPYVAEVRPGFFTDGEMDDLFGDELPGAELPADTGETRPRPVPRARAKPSGGGLRCLFGGGKAQGGKAKKKPPRVSTESLLGSVWRGAAKLATPLPPLHRTLRVQAPVAGLLLEDAVRETALDTFLQPLARLSDAGKVVSALLGPPMFVTAITLHATQRAAQGLDPNPVVMAVAQEGLRSSLMTWMDVAGPKFEEAVAREQEFEDKYGAGVDQFMAWLFAPPPSTQAETEMEEVMFRRATGIPEPATM